MEGKNIRGSRRIPRRNYLEQEKENINIVTYQAVKRCWVQTKMADTLTTRALKLRRNINRPPVLSQLAIVPIQNEVFEATGA